MPRYFFNVIDDRASLDTEGVDLPDDESAVKEAVRLSGTLLHDGTAEVATGNVWRMEVTDTAGRKVVQIDVQITPT